MDVQERPLDLTKTARDISVTERNDFKGCRRRWYLGTIENLEPKGVRWWAYDFGDGIHQGLEGYYRTVGGIQDGDPLENALKNLDVWYENLDAEIKSAGYGDLTSELRNELLEYRELGIGMLSNYAVYAKTEDDFVVCMVEGVWTPEGEKLLNKEGFNPPYSEDVHPVLHESGRFLVPIVNPETGEWVEGKPYLSARLDLVVYNKKRGLKGFWPLDHKSSASSPSDRGMDMDDQITGYDYTFYRVTGIIPRGTYFNYLIKQLPKEPRLVRDDTDLSSAKDQLTTASQYKEAMKKFGYMSKSGQITSTKHAECYESLLAYGWKRFYARFEIPRNEHELKMFELRLPHEHEDMRAVYLEPGTRAYPHLSQYNCPGCPVMRICQAIEDGSDYEEVIQSSFQQAKDRKAVTR